MQQKETNFSNVSAEQCPTYAQFVY